jgi:hypothetical protein
MKRLEFILCVVISAIVVGLFPSHVFAWWPFVTPNPTPTPTPLLLQKAPLKINPGVFQVVSTNTPTPTVTLSLSPTPTGMPTATTAVEPSITGNPQNTETPAISPSVAPTVEETPKPGQAVVGGLTQREMLFGGLAIIILLIFIIQANWTKIKTWLHNRTS